LHLKAYTLKLTEGKKPELTLVPPKSSKDKSIALRAALEELKLWQTALEAAIAAAESSEFKHKSGSSLATRFKKGMAQKLGVTDVAKSSMPQGVSMIINCIGRIVVGYSKDEAKGKEIVNNMIKMVTKLFFVMEDGKAEIKDLAPLDKNLRSALQLIADFWSPFKRKVARGVPVLNAAEMTQQASAAFEALTEEFCTFMSTYVSDRSVATIQYTLSYLTSPAILLFATTEPTLADVRVSCASEIDNYLAFENWNDEPPVTSSSSAALASPS